jgi:two-component system chemotaxis response regulator CheB
MAAYKVLVVDDSPFMRKVFSDFIAADPSFRVVATASDGGEAVELARSLDPDVITMDLEMPRMNGLEALRLIMRERPKPVIMLSAVTDNGTRDTIKALQLGAFDFIRKPDGSVKLDIRQVGETLREKLHVAVQTAHSGVFRMLPAVEEPEERPAEAPPAAEGKPPQAQPAAGAARPAAERPEPGTGRGKSPAAATASPSGAAQARAKARASARPEAPLPKASPAAKRARPEPAGLSRAEAPPPAPAAGRPKAPPRREVHAPPPRQAAGTPPAGKAARRTGTTYEQIVALGTSTGGPRALHEVLTGLPEDFPAPVVIVQHMPPKFTRSLAQRLDSFCRIHVTEAEDGERLEAGTAYIAPGGYHMRIEKDHAGHYRVRLGDDPPRSGHKPSVDVLFESLLGAADLKRHVVLMTGMGSDGAKGMKALLEDGAATTIAESEETCVVYGMPRSAVELGAATDLLRLEQIAPALIRATAMNQSGGVGQWK